MRLRLPLLFSFACALVACGESPTGPSAALSTSDALTGTARVDGAGTIGTLSVKDMPQVNSCGLDGFRIHQQRYEAAGYTKQTAEMRPGPGLTMWEAQWQGPRTNVRGVANTFVGTPIVLSSDATPILEKLFTVGGVYQVRMRGRGCGTWTEWAEFTIGDYPEQAPAPPVDPIEGPMED